MFYLGDPGPNGGRVLLGLDRKHISSGDVSMNNIMIASTSAKQMYFFVFLTFFLNTEPGMEGVLQSCCCFVPKEDDLYDSCKNKTQVRSQRVPDT